MRAAQGTVGVLVPLLVELGVFVVLFGAEAARGECEARDTSLTPKTDAVAATLELAALASGAAR